MSTSDPAQKARVRCPNCQANNFVGHSQCWQCQVSLPGSALSSLVPVSPAASSDARLAMLLRLFLAFALTLLVCVSIVIFNRMVGPASEDEENARPQTTAPSETPFAPIGAPAASPANPASGASAAPVTGAKSASNSQAQPSGATIAPTSATPLAATTGSAAPMPSPSQPNASVPQSRSESNAGANRADSASDDPVINQAKREIERAKSELILPPNAIGGDGQVHLRAGGVMSREEWEAARRKLQQGSGETNPPSTAP